MWLVHSGEAKIRSIGPMAPNTSGPHSSVSVMLSAAARGKLSRKVHVARSHASTPHTTFAPAKRAPQLLPPPPQNRSSVLSRIPSWSSRPTPPRISHVPLFCHQPERLHHRSGQFGGRYSWIDSELDLLFRDTRTERTLYG